eukprot:2300974-Prymnesium_polylepis.1
MGSAAGSALGSAAGSAAGCAPDSAAAGSSGGLLPPAVAPQVSAPPVMQASSFGSRELRAWRLGRGNLVYSAGGA